jgi:hypothetical protein
MAQNGIGLTETVVFAPGVSQKAYAYRTGLGMMGSAEYAVFMDDFMANWIVTTAITNGAVANTPSPWQAAIIDAGATITHNTTAALGANGVLTLADATASEGAAFYGQKTLQLTAAKKFFMEVRVRTDDVTDNAIQFGLTDLTATTNPEDLWTTTAANVAAFGILDGSAYPTLLADKANAGTAAVAQTVKLMTVDTWHTLAIGYDGSVLKGFVDGVEVVSTSTTIPTATALAPFFGHINGNGAGGAVVLIDYIRWSSQR